ncbi:hypothetical protein BDN71DRAFT_1459029 [Pleurotus eryngii]|uniref:Uncharacterized protein n=1 Tax=Pleurotus eryngii TaxID=5323 RepID=A0A9P5ZHW0_PLEER|nr:hypothetical protein BDN71DRAFT_1459029 [Pleurotus eryngii]
MSDRRPLTQHEGSYCPNVFGIFLASTCLAIGCTGCAIVEAEQVQENTQGPFNLV